jgi:hypothetical protein
MGKSEKPYVIERIFTQRWDSKTNTLTRTKVTNVDVVEAIEWSNKEHRTTLSPRNPANFIKDVIRGKGASAMWPALLKENRWAAVQLTGNGNVFEFVPYAAGQDEPFPTKFGYHSEVLRHRLQSVSMPLATKALGRDDETYLIQVAVRLAVVETHFALFSPIKVLELNHLQIGIKLRLCEVDSLFAATYVDDDGLEKRLIITAEAKKRNQRILEEQIVQQVRAAFNETPVDVVVPIAMTSAEDGIYLAEFRAVRRSDIGEFVSLVLETEMLYELVPRVKGI